MAALSEFHGADFRPGETGWCASVRIQETRDVILAKGQQFVFPLKERYDTAQIGRAHV